MNKTIIIIATIIVLLFALIASYAVLNLNKSNNSTIGKVIVVSPIKDSQISSPLSISGRARGSWFFEGSFPIVLLDKNRNTIAEGHVTAQGEWMTDDFVKFLGNIQFDNYIKGQRGILVLKKDNPSGLSANDDSIEIPIIFK